MKYFLNILLVVLIVSCSGTNEKANSFDPESKKKEIMAAHDIVMPKMGELRKLSKQLRAMSDSLSTSDSTAISNMIEAAENLELANENMMVWMRQYEPNFSGTEQEMKEYLEDQLVAVEKVKDDMLNTLEKGEEIVKDYN